MALSLRAGSFTILDAPGSFTDPAYGTTAHDINDSGQIVGEDRTRTGTKGFITAAQVTTPVPTGVPEPAALGLMLAALAGVRAARRRI